MEGDSPVNFNYHFIYTSYFYESSYLGV